MTQEEKARAYDEALDRCKEWASGTYEQNVNNSPKDIAEFIFPQLAESKDERIREFLIGILSQGTWRKEWPFSPNEVVAYLEKQKEQSITANDLDEEIHRFFDNCIEVHDAKIYGVDERVITVDCYEITARHFAKWGEKQKEQKPAGVTINGEPIPTENHSVDIPLTEWSEEDEQRIAEIEFAVMQMNTKRVDTKDKCLAWLKSLRPQLKQEWNEEDERILKGIIGLIDHDQHYGVSNNEMISWLKTLRPQHRAKTNDYITPHKKFFQWIYNRLIDVHGENPNVDYMQSFKKRIDNLQFSESHWKPSEDEVRLINTSISFLKDFADKGYENAVECIDWLKSKLNGNTCK